MYDQLIKLSGIFKEGFTVEIKNGIIQQYNNIEKPYIVSYKPLISLSKGYTKFESKIDIPKNCIIGGWLDKDTNIYYIELNLAFKYHFMAIEACKEHKQKAYYDNNNQKVLYVE